MVLGLPIPTSAGGSTLVLLSHGGARMVLEPQEHCSPRGIEHINSDFVL